jgi:hypothetical protein
MAEIPVEIISSGYTLIRQSRSHQMLLQAPYSRVRVDRATVDVEVILSKHLGALVDGLSRSIEDTAQHILRDTKLQAVPSELDFGLLCTFLTSMPDVPSKTCVAVRCDHGDGQY